MAKNGHYARWPENYLLSVITAFKNGDIGLKECSPAYSVLSATIKKYAEKENTVSNKINASTRPPKFSPDKEILFLTKSLTWKNSFPFNVFNLKF